jgi:hypothetical protein
VADKNVMKDALSSLRKQLRDRAGSKKIFPAPAAAAPPSITVHVEHGTPEGLETEQEEEDGPQESAGMSSIFSKETGHDVQPRKRR